MLVFREYLVHYNHSWGDSVCATKVQIVHPEDACEDDIRLQLYQVLRKLASENKTWPPVEVLQFKRI